MENIVCQFCHLLCAEYVLLQCKHPICSKCTQTQFSSELLRTPYDHLPLNTELKQKEGKQEIHDSKKTVSIRCPKCNVKTILVFSQGDIKLSNNQQLSAVDDGVGENHQQQRCIPDEMLQWVFQFLDAKELFKQIRFTCQRVDKIVCTSLLSLHCQGLRMNVLKFAHEVLPIETQLQDLNLMLSNIGDNEATKIVTLFPVMQQLQILNLSWNQIGNTGATAIANSINHLKQLQVLDISWNPIGDFGITAISNTTKELTKLQQLELSDRYHEKVYEQVMELFTQKGTKLDLMNCNIDGACAIVVAKMLPHLTQLQRLNLGYNEIGYTGATAIANTITNVTQLQELYLHSNQIGDIGATAIINSITNLTKLKRLCFSDNQIGDIGATAIANSLSYLTRLQQLDLRFNQIGDSGATAIANSISKLTQFEKLYLGKTNINEPAKQQLQEQFGDKLEL